MRRAGGPPRGNMAIMLVPANGRLGWVSSHGQTGESAQTMGRDARNSRPVLAVGSLVRAIDDRDDRHRREVTVVFTTTDGTRAALADAQLLALGLHGHVRLIVPEIIPFPAPIDHPLVSPALMVLRLTALLPWSPVPTGVEVHLCRDARVLLRRRLEPHSIVLIGAGGHLWSWHEKRLVGLLRGLGHVAFLVPPARRSGARSALDVAETRDTTS